MAVSRRSFCHALLYSLALWINSNFVLGHLSVTIQIGGKISDQIVHVIEGPLPVIYNIIQIGNVMVFRKPQIIRNEMRRAKLRKGNRTGGDKQLIRDGKSTVKALAPPLLRQIESVNRL